MSKIIFIFQLLFFSASICPAIFSFVCCFFFFGIIYFAVLYDVGRFGWGHVVPFWESFSGSLLVFSFPAFQCRVTLKV